MKLNKSNEKVDEVTKIFVNSKNFVKTKLK